MLKYSVSPSMMGLFISILCLYGCSDNAVQSSLSKQHTQQSGPAKSAESFNDWSWLSGRTLGCTLPGRTFKLYEFQPNSVIVHGGNSNIEMKMSKPQNGQGFILSGNNEDVLFIPSKGKYEGISVVIEFEDVNSQPFVCYHYQDGEPISSDGSFDLDSLPGEWNCDGEIDSIGIDSKLNFHSGNEVGTIVLVGSKSYGFKFESHFLYRELSKPFADKIEKYQTDISNLNNGQLLIEKKHCTKVK